MGLGGDMAHAARYAASGGEIAATFRERGYGGSFAYLFEEGEIPPDADGAARLERIRESIAEAARRDGPNDRLLLLLVGHADRGGAKERGYWRFHLPGPDLDLASLREALAAYPGEVLIVAATPFSGLVADALAEPRRWILAADGKNKGNVLAHPEALARAIASLAPSARLADLLPAFVAAVNAWYAENRFLATETPRFEADAGRLSTAFFAAPGPAWATIAKDSGSAAAGGIEDNSEEVYDTEAIRRDTTAPAGADAVVLLRRLEITIDEAGLYTERRRDVVRILTPRARGMADLEYSYRPPDETWELVHARVILPDSVVEVRKEGILESSQFDPEIPAWVEGRTIKVVRIHFPAMAPGSVADLEYVRKSRSFGVGQAPGMEMNLVEEIPVRRLDLRVTVPRRVEVAVAVRRLEGLTITPGRYGKTYRLLARDLPAAAPEPFSPPLEDLAPRLVIAPVETWDRVARWYARLANATREADTSVTDAAAQFRPEATERDLYDWVATKIRYVHIPLGWHSAKPYQPAGTLRRGYGDCKDKAALLLSALAGRGVKGYFALLRAGAGEILSEVPRSGAFNHAIVALPRPEGGFLFLDPTSEVAPYVTLPNMDEGREILVILEDTGILTRTPVSTPEENRIEIDRVARRTAEGLHVSETRTLYGQSAFLSRMFRRHASPEEVRAAIAQNLAGHYAGATLLDLGDENGDSATAPLREFLTYRIPIPEGLLPIPLGGFYPFLPPPPRRSPISLPARLLVHETTVLARSGFENAGVPAGAEIRNDAGEVDLAFEADGPTLVARRRILLPRRDLPVTSYEALRAILAPAPFFLGAAGAGTPGGRSVPWILMIGLIGIGIFAIAILVRRRKR